MALGNVAGADGVAVSAGVCAGVVCVVRPPTTPPTVVPPPCRCQTTAFSGLPTDNSNTVMAATATRNVPTAIPVITSQRGLVFLPPPSLAAGVPAGTARDRPPVTAKISVGESCIGSFRLMGFGEPVTAPGTVSSGRRTGRISVSAASGPPACRRLVTPTRF